MALFEVHMRAAAFAAAQRQTLLTRKLCISMQNVAGVNLSVQRVRFGAGSIRRGDKKSFPVYYRDTRINPVPPYFTRTENFAKGFIPELVQNLTLDVTAEEAVMNSPNTAPPFVSVDVSVVSQIAYKPAPAGGCVLSVEFHGVEWESPITVAGFDPASITATIETLLSAQLPSVSVPFNFTTLLPAGVNEIANAGVAFDPAADVIAFRVDPFGTTSNSDVPWTNFYGGLFTPRLTRPDQDWGYFIDRSTLEPKFETAIEGTLKQRGVSGMKLISVYSKYVAGVQPSIVTVINANLHTPGPDMHVEPTISSTLSLTTNPVQLAVDIDLGEVKKLIDSFADVIESLKTFAPPLGWIAELAAGESIANAQASLAGIDIDVNGLVCEQLSATRHRCVMQPPMPKLNNISLGLSDLIAQPDGILISGRLAIANFTPSSLHIPTAPDGSDTEPPAFGWRGPHVTCSQVSNALLDDVRADPGKYAALFLQVDLVAIGNTPVWVCDVQIVNDPLGVFDAAAGDLRVEGDRLPARITYGPPVPRDERYLADPYPLDLLVRTTAGVRLVRVPPPPPFEQDDATMVADGVKVQLLACPNLPAWMLGELDHFDIEWIEDPLTDPDYETITHHGREITVLGLAEGQTLTVRDASSGVALSEVTARSSGEAVSVVIVREAAVDSGLRMLVAGAHDGASIAAHRVGVEIHQQATYAVASVALTSPLTRVASAAGVSGNAVAAVTASGVSIFSLAHPAAPARLATFEPHDFVDVATGTGGLVMAGRHQLFTVGADLVPRVFEDVTDSPITAIDADSANVYLLTESALEVRAASSLRLRAALPLENAAGMQRIGDQLIIGLADKVTTLSYDSAGFRFGSEAMVAGGVARLEPVVINGRSTVNVIGSDGAAWPWDIARNQVSTAQSLPGRRPMLRIGSMVVHGTPGETWFHIGRLGPRRPVPPSQPQSPR